MQGSLPRRLLFSVSIIVPTLGFAAFVFFHIGGWLVVSDPPPPRLDYIYTFAGENPRLWYSRELMERYKGAHWVLCDFNHYYSRILNRNGFDMTRVSIIDTASYTLSEVRALADWLRAHPPAQKAFHPATRTDTAAVETPLQIGLVSNPYHMRRIQFMVKDVFRDSTKSFRFYYLPVPFERFQWSRGDKRQWWRVKAHRSFVGSEIGKLIMYLLFL
jgi:hypothetical protein